LAQCHFKGTGWDILFSSAWYFGVLAN